jgi:orotate phosphoribosyltransferase
LAPKEGDPILDQQKSIVLKSANFQLKALAMSSGKDASYFMEVQEVLKDNPFVEKIRERICVNEVNDEFEFNDGLFYFKGLLYIPPGPI